MTKYLTDHKIWEKYWRSKRVDTKVSKNFPLHDIFEKYLTHKSYKNMIEVGGFPGLYAIYFKKYWDYEATILDYIIDKKRIKHLLKINDLTPKDVSIIKADFLNYQSRNKFDFVYSLGFIEHFIDTKDLIRRHWNMVNKGGTMIIGIPNMLGINGIYQLLFDPSNLNIHNLKSMDINHINHIMRDLEISKYKIFYRSRSLVWLEDLPSRHFLLRLLTYLLNAVGIMMTVFGIKGKLSSTHIFIIAEK